MTGWMIWFTGLFGDTERFVRFPAVLSSGLVTAMVYEISTRIFSDRRIGFVTALLTNALPIFAMGGFIVTPDTPLVLFWVAALYSGFMLVETQKPGWWYAIGFFFGLAMLSKYTAAFFAPCLLLFLLFSPANRYWLFRREPYLAFALSFILFSPVIYWNFEQGWASFSFQFAHGLIPEERDRVKDFLDFWGLQIGIYGLFLFFFIVAAAFGVNHLGRHENRDDYRYLAFMSFPILIFFLINSLRTEMQGNWSVIAYISAVIATPGWVSEVSLYMREKRARLLQTGFTFSIIFSLSLLIIAHIQIVEPLFPMPQKREISRRVYGWEILGNRTGDILKSMAPDTFILSSRYQITSLLKFYTPGRPASYKTEGKRRFGSFIKDDKIAGRNAVYVIETERVDLDRISPWFDKVEPAGTIRIERRNELIREFSFFKCFNYRSGLIKS